MRKWSPDPFPSEENTAPESGLPSPEFAAREFTSLALEEVPSPAGSGFAKDPSLTGVNTHWDHMHPLDKDDLLERARKSLAAEFEARDKEREERFRADLETVRGDFVARFHNWTAEFSDALRHEERTLASDAVGLALALAKKIIRDTVEIDRGFVLRTLETALFKVGDARPLSVSLHPDDVELLENDPALKSGLHIEKIVADRRVERGGCRIRAGRREWDATLSGQLDTLSAVVEEALGASDQPDIQPLEVPDEPGLE